MKVFAQVFTTSNYRGLNDQWLEVDKFLGSIVSVKLFNPVTGEPTTADFNLKEIKEFRHEKPKSIIKMNEEELR